MAGLALCHRKPKQRAHAENDISIKRLLYDNITANAKKEKRDKPDASPSSPSVTLTAFCNPTKYEPTENRLPENSRHI